jgi:hypothetical protein
MTEQGHPTADLAAISALHIRLFLEYISQSPRRPGNPPVTPTEAKPGTVHAYGRAENRAVLLRDILPALGLGGQVRVDGRFVLVTGQRHSYRIHLRSGNIRIEPSGQYLCIVPRLPTTGTVYLPFEEADLKTAEILSKILLLARDGQIRDHSILAQL